MLAGRLKDIRKDNEIEARTAGDVLEKGLCARARLGPGPFLVRVGRVRGPPQPPPRYQGPPRPRKENILGATTRTRPLRRSARTRATSCVTNGRSWCRSW